MHLTSSAVLPYIYTRRPKFKIYLNPSRISGESTPPPIFIGHKQDFVKKKKYLNFLQISTIWQALNNIKGYPQKMQL